MITLTCDRCGTSAKSGFEEDLFRSAFDEDGEVLACLCPVCYTKLEEFLDGEDL